MKLILASQSPRRKELLSHLGLPFSVLSPKVDETRKPNESGARMVKRLSRLKARAVAAEIKEGACLVLAADTTVVTTSGKILEKPKDKAHAYKMLYALQGSTHVVLTAYCLMKVQSQHALLLKSRTVKTRVRFKKMSRKDILNYLKTDESMDKAGAYAAQGKGSVFVQSICGSYTNVVGLPMAELIDDLKELKII